MNFIKKLQEAVIGERYAPQEQALFGSMLKEASALEALEAMKATPGWKLLESKMRETLTTRITEKLKGDDKIQVLLDILGTVETKQASQVLEEEVARIIPD